MKLSEREREEEEEEEEVCHSMRYPEGETWYFGIFWFSPFSSSDSVMIGRWEGGKFFHVICSMRKKEEEEGKRKKERRRKEKEKWFPFSLKSHHETILITKYFWLPFLLAALWRKKEGERKKKKEGEKIETGNNSSRLSHFLFPSCSLSFSPPLSLPLSFSIFSVSLYSFSFYIYIFLLLLSFSHNFSWRKNARKVE